MDMEVVYFKMPLEDKGLENKFRLFWKSDVG